MRERRGATWSGPRQTAQTCWENRGCAEGRGTRCREMSSPRRRGVREAGAGCRQESTWLRAWERSAWAQPSLTRQSPYRNVQPVAVLGVEVHVQCSDVVAHLGCVLRAGDDGGDSRPAEHPAQGQLSRRCASLPGGLPQARKHLVVVASCKLAEQRQPVPAIVAAESRFAVVLSREQTLCPGAVRESFNSKLATQRDELRFRLAPQQAVLELNCRQGVDRMRPAHFGRAGVADSNRADKTCFDQLGESSHAFLERHVRVWAMKEVQRDGVHTETLEAGLDRVSQVRAASVGERKRVA